MIDILFLIGLYIFGVFAVYSLGFGLSDRKETETVFFKNIHVHPVMKRYLLPANMSSDKNSDKMNLLGVIFHFTVSASFVLLYPVFFILTFYNKDLAVNLLIIWGGIACCLTAILAILLTVDNYVCWRNRRQYHNH